MLSANKYDHTKGIFQSIQDKLVQKLSTIFYTFVKN